ncbi:MAG: polyprenyl synthetase family protein [Candidatus Uhrbacteria bacterium]
MKQALAFKKRFDRVLARYLDVKVKELRVTTQDPFVLGLVKHTRVLLMAGGKRIRPYLAFLAYQAAGGKDERILDTLVGLEIFHMFALIHDDIMDKGLERHGVATAHAVYGDAQAILLGDLLFGWASEIVAASKGGEIFSRMVQEVILGQMLDVDAICRKKVSDEFIQDKMRLKTASYTFIRPMQFGVALSHVGAIHELPLHEFCENFGLHLGLAFQIQDDLLDLTVSSEVLGKPVLNDIREGQKTVFTQYVAKNTKYDLDSFKGKKVSLKSEKAIRKIFEESGAIEHGKNLMDRYFDEALFALESSGLSLEKQKPFVELVEYIRSRKS